MSLLLNGNFKYQRSINIFFIKSIFVRKEFDCVMQFMLEEHGVQAAGYPLYIGLEANIADYRRNIYKWASPMSKQ